MRRRAWSARGPSSMRRGVNRRKIDQSLRHGYRGLPGGDSLSALVAGLGPRGGGPHGRT
jgi:hypothetical protein